MSDPISVRCPACKARLTLKSRDQQGRKIACPKCGKPFVVPAPKTTDDEDEAMFAQLEEQDSAAGESTGRLPPRRSATSGGKKPRPGGAAGLVGPRIDRRRRSGSGWCRGYFRRVELAARQASRERRGGGGRGCC